MIELLFDQYTLERIYYVILSVTNCRQTLLMYHIPKNNVSNMISTCYKLRTIKTMHLKYKLL